MLGVLLSIWAGVAELEQIFPEQQVRASVESYGRSWRLRLANGSSKIDQLYVEVGGFVMLPDGGESFALAMEGHSSDWSSLTTTGLIGYSHERPSALLPGQEWFTPTWVIPRRERERMIPTNSKISWTLRFWAERGGGELASTFNLNESGELKRL